jgi:hypothetical protein
MPEEIRKADEAELSTREVGELEPNETELSTRELDELQAEGLPDRENMSLINANVAVPVNAAVAANVLTNQSTATATATQNAPVNQHAGP